MILLLLLLLFRSLTPTNYATVPSQEKQPRSPPMTPVSIALSARETHSMQGQSEITRSVLLQAKWALVSGTPAIFLTSGGLQQCSPFQYLIPVWCARKRFSGGGDPRLWSGSLRSALTRFRGRECRGSVRSGKGPGEDIPVADERVRRPGKSTTKLWK